MTLPNPKRLKMDEEAANSSTMEKETPVADFDPFASTFGEIVNKTVFVDKTPLIKTIFETSARGVLITAPRRFGKSTNLNMVKTYVEMKADENGIAIDKSANYQIFKDLLICKDQNFSDEHFAAYPVIYADFKSINGKTFDNVFDKFREMLHEAFKQHKYLLKSDKLDSGEISRFNMYCDNMSYRNLTENDVEKGLKFLSECLYIHFDCEKKDRKKVFVLIDEYDAPINNTMFKEKIKIEDVNELLTMIFSNTLKTNEYVERALLTGISYFATVGLSGANNIEKYMFLQDHPFVNYYGLTENEVDNLLSAFNISNKEQIKDYYNGYYSKNGKNIFCLWSVLNYLQKRELKSYWEKSGLAFGLEEAIHAPVIQYQIEKFLKKRSVVFEIFEKITYTEIQKLRNVIVKKDTQISNPDLFLNFLFHQGYLTYDVKNNTENKNSFVIPNFEVRDEFKRILITFFSPSLDQELAACAAVVDKICSTDIQVYQEFIKKFQSVVDKVDKKIVEENERIFHSHLFNVICKSAFCVGDDIELEGSRRKPDLVIIKDNIGIIIEVKYKHDSKKALKQIIDKKYYIKFDEDKFKETITDKIYLGLNVSEDLIVSLSVLINSLEISEAKDYNI